MMLFLCQISALAFLTCISNTPYESCQTREQDLHIAVKKNIHNYVIQKEKKKLSH